MFEVFEKTWYYLYYDSIKEKLFLSKERPVLNKNKLNTPKKRYYVHPKYINIVLIKGPITFTKKCQTI